MPLVTHKVHRNTLIDLNLFTRLPSNEGIIDPPSSGGESDFEEKRQKRTDVKKSFGTYTKHDNCKWNMKKDKLIYDI